MWSSEVVGKLLSSSMGMLGERTEAAEAFEWLEDWRRGFRGNSSWTACRTLVMDASMVGWLLGGRIDAATPLVVLAIMLSYAMECLRSLRLEDSAGSIGCMGSKRR